MAPEMFLGQSYDEKCDVFSYAIVMHEVLHAKLNPFGTHAQYIAMCNSTILRPQISTTLDTWLQDMIRACWQHAPQYRPTFTQLVHEWEERLKS